MLKHSDIWRAIDRLAAAKGLSPSALAKSAGLDPTTFNRSKRQGDEGKLRWPSTESISKILEATNTPLSAFLQLFDNSQGQDVVQRIPVIGYAQAGNDGFFDEVGYPVGRGWDELLFPALGDPHAYALEISGDSMEPVYRDGDVVVVSPGAPYRRGDRVVVKTREGEVLAKQLLRKSATRIELLSVNPERLNRTFNLDEVLWVARIIWVSQ
ncbi:DNA-binding protein [Azospirillaceae bacterium]